MLEFYERYLADTTALAKTLTIKSSDSIDRINNLMRLQYGEASVDLYDLTTWKYYLNICGLYHPTDTVMTVLSLDTLEEISFIPAILENHPETRMAYGYKSAYYETLVSRYPNQEQLILGILYPAEMETAIAAPDGAILAYPPELVEPQEATLLTSLETWIKNFLLRWHVRAFGESDSLYATAHHAILYLNILPKLLNLRVERCKTFEAHSFHIRSYLASHGRLDRFMDYMTLKQQLFFYRNICYLERHPGTVNTFAWLIQKVMSDRYLPIAEFSARYLGTFTEDYTPEYWFRKKPLNTEYNIPEKNYFVLDELLTKEAPLATGNTEYSHELHHRIDYAFKRSLSNVVQTKALESSMIDYTDSEPQTLSDLILNHWAYMASNGLYDAPIRFDDPFTEEPRILDTATAFLYLFYITLKSQGIELTTVPGYFVKRVRRRVKPSVADLCSVVLPGQLPAETVATALLSIQPTLFTLRSRSAFFTLCKKLHTASLKYWFLVSNTHHMVRRGLIDAMVNRLYDDAFVTFPDTGQPIADWLTAHHLPTTDYTSDQLKVLTKLLFSAGTGYTVDETKSLKNIQKAMIGIMEQLSSYTIQFIREINESPIQILNWAAIRIGEQRVSQWHRLFARENIDVVQYETVGNAGVFLNVKPYWMTTVVESQQAVSLEWQSTVFVESDTHEIRYESVVLSPMGFMAEYEGVDPSVISRYGAIGYEGYLGMTAEQQAAVVDVYH